MVRVFKITKARKDLLKIADSLKNDTGIIITCENHPVAALIGIEKYEEYFTASRNRAGLPALLVLGAKNCARRAALESIESVNKNADDLFSKIIFVCGKATLTYANRFAVSDLRVVYNEKASLPLITSVKCGITALSASDRWFVITFLSAPQENGIFRRISKAASASAKGIIIVRKNGRPAHPVAFAARYVDMFIKTRKELGIPYLIKKFRDDIKYLDI